MVAPFDPPFLLEVSSLSKVPEACHARRTVNGQTLTLELTIAEVISERTAFSTGVGMEDGVCLVVLDILGERI